MRLQPILLFMAWCLYCSSLNRFASSFVIVTTGHHHFHPKQQQYSSMSTRRLRSMMAVASSSNDDAAAASNASDSSKMKMMNDKSALSIAILGGGISGLSCASQLLSRHKQSSLQYSKLEVTVFDTGRLRPGGRCSSRLPEDVAVATEKEVKNNNNKIQAEDARSNRRACDNDASNSSNGGGGGDIDTINNDNNARMQIIPMNIQKAINNNGKSAATTMGPVDHAAQILSIPTTTATTTTTPTSSSSSFEEFRNQLQSWLNEGIIEQFPMGSVCELVNNDASDTKSVLSSVDDGKGMYYGKGGMGSIPIAMREYCLSFNNEDDDNKNGKRSFRIMQDVWVSPSNGVKYIGSTNNDTDGSEDTVDPQWELWAGKKSLGQYHRLVIAHNGKCADRIMSRTPAKAFHSLLRTQFAPYVPQWGGNQMTLNSIYSLVFAVKSSRSGNSRSNSLSSPIAKALSNLSATSSSSSNTNGIYTVMIKNEPNLRLLSCNTLKHHHTQNPNSDSIIEVYTLLSSAKFGKQFKGPQENLPPELVSTVVMKLLRSLERSLELQEGEVVDSVIDLKLQLWGAAVPLNTWSTTTTTTTTVVHGNQQRSVGDDGGIDGFVYDATYGVGACGDWILDPSVAGAWESGRRLAHWLLLNNNASVGLPNRSSTNEGSGKLVPSLAALGSGIGTVPTSSNVIYEFPPPSSNNGSKANDRKSTTKSNSYRRQNGGAGRGSSNRRGDNKSRGPAAQPVSR